MQEILHLINEMSPYLLLGFLFAGILHAFVPQTQYNRYLGKNSFSSVVNAAILGIPLPLCSCGVIPTALSLRRNGASKGATVSFLIATPQTGVDSIAATYSLMGLPFALVRPLAALCTSLLGGALANFTNKDVDSCQECRESSETETSGTFLEKCIEALRFGYVDMMQDIGKWLVTGLVVAALITILVPDNFFTIFNGNTLASMLLVFAIALPMYVCATGSIPIAVALMMKGLTPGAGLVLLMAGPACNMASILVINKVLGRKSLITYLVSIITGAISFGLVIDHVLPRQWFLSNLIAQDACCHESQSWFSIGCTILLMVLLANALIRYFIGRYNSKTITINTDTMKQTFIINGMNCNHCRTSAEKAILSVPGVTSASVDLATKVAQVEGTATAEAICKAVEEVGFTCTES